MPVPAFQRSISFLNGLVGRLTAAKQWRLPSLRAMAAECGVSYVTFHKALRLFCDQGIVEAVGKGGYIIVTSKKNGEEKVATRPDFELPARTPRWQYLADRIARDITDGILTDNDGSLPSYKHLSVRYGTSYSTAGKALGLLVARDLIKPAGRGYCVPRPLSPEGTTYLYLLAPWDEMPVLTTYTPRTQELLWELDHQCRRAGLILRVCSYRRATGSLRWFDGSVKNILGAQRESSILGYVVLTPGSIGSGLFDKLLEMLSGSGKPVCIMDEAGWNAPEQYRKKKFCFLQTGLGRAPGRDLGKYLVRLGHRSIAYLADLKNSVDARQRYEGLAEALNESGVEHRLVNIPLMPLINLETLQRNLAGISIYRELVEVTRNLVRFLETHAGGIPYPTYAYEFPIWNMLRNNYHIAYLRNRHFFEKALAERDITAWVCYSDSFAIAALHFLQSRKIPVPQRISVAGIDNTFEAAAYALTSYSFNVPAVVSAAVKHVLGDGGKRKKDFVGNIRGIVAVRQSTGPAKT